MTKAPRYARHRARKGTAFLLLFVAASAAPLAAEDVLVRRDGSRVTGRLQACAGDRCQWSGSAVPRTEIAWIGLGQLGVPPLPANPAQDAVWLAAGRAVAGQVIGVSLGEVATDDESFERPDVAWIYFGSPAGMPALAAEAVPEPPRMAPAPSAVELLPAASPGAAPRVPVAAVPEVRPAAPPAATAPVPAQLFLNEVGVLAHGGRNPFVELSNPGTEPISLDGVALGNERGATCPLPKSAKVPASSLYLIALDGAAGGGGAHCPPQFLSKMGHVELRSAGGVWDRLEWGDTPFGLALRTRGGRIAEVAPGSSFGRRPRAPAIDASPWVRYSRTQVTPGLANPIPAVDNFMALPGAIFERREVPLTWYTVGGVQRYRVQVSPTADFSAPLFERSLDTPEARANGVAKVTTQPLADGRYFWRVQALGAGGEAPFSEPKSFEVRAARASARSSATANGGKSGAAEPPAAPTPAEAEQRVLPVPYIEQNKDTWLLALEADAEAPNYRPWDRPWQVQPPYCARASIAMVNAYYHAKLNLPGTLSQDRITYEAYHDRMREAGPEIDIYVDAGMNAPMMIRALKYALGASPRRAFLVPLEAWEERYSTSARAEEFFIWEHVVNEIKQERPVVGTSECHAWVYAGYRVSGGHREFRILDPAMGSYWFRPGVFRELTEGNDEPAGEALAETFFLPNLAEARPASDEPSIEPDSDGDGVRDFDEEVRFKTSVRDQDSDADGVHDKEEIRASVFEPRHGWSVRTRNVRPLEPFPDPADTGRDLDRDGLAMEMDPDSDNGGCQDGDEDFNGNGQLDPGETSNFDPADDPANEEGCALWTGTAEMRLWTRKPLERMDIRVVAEVRMREVDLQPLGDPGPAQGGRELGARIGSQVHLQCLSMTLTESWRTELRSESGEIQVMTAQGGKTIDTFSPTAGLIWRNRSDLDVTPFLGYDIPSGGGLYVFSGCDFEFRNDLETVYTCSGSRSCHEPFSQYAPFTGPYGIGRAPLEPAVACADPEIRLLEAGGQQMTGSFSFRVPDGVCVTTDGALAWSFCKAGTACAALPALPAMPP